MPHNHTCTLYNVHIHLYRHATAIACVLGCTKYSVLHTNTHVHTNTCEQIHARTHTYTCMCMCIRICIYAHQQSQSFVHPALNCPSTGCIKKLLTECGFFEGQFSPTALHFGYFSGSWHILDHGRSAPKLFPELLVLEGVT